MIRIGSIDQLRTSAYHRTVPLYASHLDAKAPGAHTKPLLCGGEGLIKLEKLADSQP